MPLFLGVEGLTGSGKSTQAHLLASALRSRGLAVTETREPGGTPIGDRLRELILNPASPDATPLPTVFMLSASRAEHVAEVTRPALERGEVVSCDRFSESTRAYQGFGLGVPIEKVEDSTSIAVQAVRPRPVIYIAVPAYVGIERLDTRGAQDRIDAQTRAFHERVRDGYFELMRREPDRWVCIDGNRPPGEVHRSVLAVVDRLLERVPDAV